MIDSKKDHAKNLQDLCKSRILMIQTIFAKHS